jgi:tRNA nucleotidyltransferase/poly(A) polymerase
VGGFLRDALLGRSSDDMDLAVKGDAEKLARRFARRVGGSVFALDRERGVYRVTLEGKTFDFAELQGPTIEKDLARRDFTVNAMAMPVDEFRASGAAGKLLDPQVGKKDLKARRMRAVSEKGFLEDPLRLLRAVRQSAELEFSIAPTTWVLLRRHAGRIRRAAPERVREELLKMCETPRAADAVRDLEKAGLLAVLWPESNKMRRTARDFYGRDGVLGHALDVVASFEHVLESLPVLFPSFHKPLAAHLREPVSGHPLSALLKLGALLHDAGKPSTAEKGEDGKPHFHGHEHAGAKLAAKAAGRWRMSKEETRILTRIVRGHMRPGNLGNVPVLTDRAIYRFYRDFEEDAVSVLVVALGDHFAYLSERARRGGKDPVFRAVRKMLGNYFLKKETVAPPKIIDGHAIMKALKIKPGPKVGEILEGIREAQAAGKVKTPEEALALGRKLIKRL